VTNLKKLVPIIALIWVATSGASDPAPTWGFWQTHVYNSYCELSNEYHIPFRNDPFRRGFLSGTTLDRAFVRFRADAQLHGESAGIHAFLLGVDESTQLLQRFTDNETVEFELKFASGDLRQFKIYPSGNRTFYVWADMFQTCIRSHKGKNR